MDKAEPTDQGGLHPKYQHGYSDGIHDSVLELLETAVTTTIASGWLHPDDLSHRLGEAIALGESRRAGPPPPTFRQAQDKAWRAELDELIDEITDDRSSDGEGDD
jgi:hypothetical protein